MILAQFGDWLEVPVQPILRERVLLRSFLSYSMKSLLLSSTDQFLMSEYLTLSGPGAVSLLNPESESVNSSSVIRSSFEPASVRDLSSTFQTAFLFSG